MVGWLVGHPSSDPVVVLWIDTRGVVVQSSQRLAGWLATQCIHPTSIRPSTQRGQYTNWCAKPWLLCVPLQRFRCPVVILVVLTVGGVVAGAVVDILFMLAASVSSQSFHDRNVRGSFLPKWSTCSCRRCVSRLLFVAVPSRGNGRGKAGHLRSAKHWCCCCCCCCC